MRILAWVWRVLRALLLALAIVWIFVEEWGWHPLAAWLGRFARWSPWARLEARIARVPPRLALLLFLVPVVLLAPVKLLALWLIQAGRPVLGVGVIVAAKLLGTAIGGRLFLLTEPQLMRLRQFARLVRWWRRVRRRVKAAVEASPGWRALRSALSRWRARLRELL